MADSGGFFPKDIDYAALADDMPHDRELLEGLGKVQWAASRLRAGIRDALNKIGGEPSDHPFDDTLGGCLNELQRRSKSKLHRSSRDTEANARDVER